MHARAGQGRQSSGRLYEKRYLRGSHSASLHTLGFRSDEKTGKHLRPRQITARRFRSATVLSCFRRGARHRAAFVEVRSKRAHHPVSSPSGRRGTLCRGSLAKGLRKPPVLCRASGTGTLGGREWAPETQGSALRRGGGAPSRKGASCASNSASISARCSLARSRWTASWSLSDASSRSFSARSAWHF